MIGKTNVSSGNEIININLLTNQSSNLELIGAKITILYGVIKKDLTWEGSTISEKIPGNVNYTIEFSNIVDYKTPEKLSYKAVIGNSRDITVQYKTEIVKVSLNSNVDVSCNGQIITIDGKEFTYQGSEITKKIPFGKLYSISVNSKAGFNTPAAKTFTANSTSRTVTMTYTRIMYNYTVTVKTDDGISPNGAIVNIGGTSKTYNGPVTVSVPYGSNIGCTVSKTYYNSSSIGAAVITSNVSKTITINRASTTISAKANVSGTTITCNGLSKTYNGKVVKFIVKLGYTYNVSGSKSYYYGDTNSIFADRANISTNLSLSRITVTISASCNINGATISCNGESKTYNGSEVNFTVYAGNSYTVSASKPNYSGDSTTITVETTNKSVSLYLNLLYETVYVTLNTDDGESCNGLTIYCSYNNQSKIYNGSEIAFTVPYGTYYTISVDSKNYYNTPDNRNTTGSTNNWHITMTYTRLYYYINVIANVSDVSISCNGESKIYNNSAVSFRVKAGNTYTVLGSKNNYNNDSKTVNVQNLDIDISLSLSRLYEIVYIDLSTDDGESCSGETVYCSYNNQSKIYQGNLILFSVPYGEAYTISVSDKTYYSTPSSKSTTANSSSWSLNFIYKRNYVTLSVTANINDVSITCNGSSKTYNGSAVNFSVAAGGYYNVSASKDWYNSASDSGYMGASDKTIDLSLTRKTCTISVTANISGVAITCNYGQSQIYNGSAVTFTVNQGETYKISGSKEYYNSDSIYVSADSSSKTISLNLSRKTVTVSVSAVSDTGVAINPTITCNDVHKTGLNVSFEVILGTNTHIIFSDIDGFETPPEEALGAVKEDRSISVTYIEKTYTIILNKPVPDIGEFHREPYWGYKSWLEKNTFPATITKKASELMTIEVEASFYDTIIWKVPNENNTFTLTLHRSIEHVTDLQMYKLDNPNYLIFKRDCPHIPEPKCVATIRGEFGSVVNTTGRIFSISSYEMEYIASFTANDFNAGGQAWEYTTNRDDFKLYYMDDIGVVFHNKYICVYVKKDTSYGTHIACRVEIWNEHDPGNKWIINANEYSSEKWSNGAKLRARVVKEDIPAGYYLPDWDTGTLVRNLDANNYATVVLLPK